MTTTDSLSSTSAAPAESLAPAAAPAATNGFSITALVLGIAGIALGQGLLAIGAIIFGFVARAREPRGRLMANWGIVLGFVGVFGGILIAIVGFAAFAPFWALGGWDFGGWDFADIAGFGMGDAWGF
jgi:hypothetical protein